MTVGRPRLPPGPYLVVGLARSGQAVARVLRERGERVVGVDVGRPAGAQDLAAIGVELHLQQEGVLLPEHVAVVVKSPGVPAGAPALARARQLGRPVIGELEVGWRLLANETIAVTGTNGKTTTVELIGHIHRTAGEPVAVAGNVGTALSSLVGSLDERATIVCEASSFQLEDAISFAPEVAVLLNVAPDHLDRHGTMAAYTEAKLRIFANQREQDVAVLPDDVDLPPVPGSARQVRFGGRPDSELRLLDGRLRWRGESLLGVEEVGIPGRHNLQNAMAAAAACLARGLDPEAVRAGLRSFGGVAHRLELVAERGGVRFVNDSKATNLASTLMALEAMAPAPVTAALAGANEQASASSRTIHLILGGQGKGQDFAPLAAAVARTCRSVYLIGEDASLIATALTGIEPPVEHAGTLERAVSLSRERAREGEVVLLSPACASFDQFADFEARGERFRELVR